jgi:hypothetical protein
MIKLVLALVITAMAATASARGTDRFAFLQCGVKLGGKYLTYKASPQETSRKYSRMNHVAGVAETEPSRFTLSAASTASSPTPQTGSSSTIEFRLPRKITVATIGCSWL